MNEDKLILLNPVHIRNESDGFGEFPDSYYVTEKGFEKIKNYIDKKRKYERT